MKVNGSPITCSMRHSVTVPKELYKCLRLAPSLGFLIVARILQGLGGGGLAPSEQPFPADTFPIEKRGQAFALCGMAVVVAPAVGPTLGGWITDN